MAQAHFFLEFALLFGGRELLGARQVVDSNGKEDVQQSVCGTACTVIVFQ